jgi:transcriptional regulator with XRE-family HTH domain
VSKSSVLHQRIAKKIRDLRKAKDKMSQEKLALTADLNRAYIGYIERGERKPSVDTLARIAKGLGVPLYELFKFD